MMSFQRALSRAICACAAIAAACAPGTIISWLPAEEARSILLVTTDQDGSNARVEAIALDGSPRTLRVAEGSYELHAIRLRRPLGELFLRPGMVALSDRGVRLPAADVPILRSLVHDSVPGPWTAVPELPPHLARLRIAVSPCVELESTAVALEGSENEGITFAIAMEQGTALIATTGGLFFRATDAGLERIDELPRDTPHQAGAYDAVKGELWLADERGRVVRGKLGARGWVDAQPVDVPPIPTATITTVRLSGGAGADGFELFAATGLLQLFHFDGTAWSLVHDRGDAAADRSRLDVAWIGPGAAIATGWGNQLVLFHERGTTREDFIALEAQVGNPDALYSTKNVPGFGAAIGTRYAYVFTYQDNTWRSLPFPPTDPRTSAIIELDGSLLFGGQHGVLIQYFPDYGYCSPQLIASFDVDNVLRLDTKLIAVQTAENDAGPARVVFLVPVRAP